jgi:hypothetical protein
VFGTDNDVLIVGHLLAVRSGRPQLPASSAGIVAPHAAGPGSLQQAPWSFVFDGVRLTRLC